jgi:metal-responsive CopG/Arc/MetJ family transcriptional regulator
MPQISIRLHQWMLDKIDAVIEHERHGEGDRATIIREAISAYLAEPRK